MVLLDFFIDVIADVNLGSGGYNHLDFAKQFIHIQSLGNGNILEAHLTVDALDDEHLDGRFLDHGFHHKVLRTFYLILFHIIADKFNKTLAVLLRLAHAHARDVRHLLHGSRVLDAHIFQ